MTLSRKIWKCFGTFLLIGTIVFTSCKKKEDAFEAKVDVYVQRVTIGTSDSMAVVLSAYGNRDLKTVKATAPGTGGKVYNLAVTSSGKQWFSYIPVAADYVKTMPANGAYSFEVTATDNSKLTVTNLLGTQSLAAINLKTATFVDGKLKTTWDALTGADTYTVKLFSADGNTLLYVAPVLSSTTLEYSFNSTTSGWVSGKTPAVGTSYLVQILGVKYEDGVTSDKSNHIQFISLTNKTITWQ